MHRTKAMHRSRESGMGQMAITARGSVIAVVEHRLDRYSFGGESVVRSLH
jgi:hypothetical protein